VDAFGGSDTGTASITVATSGTPIAVNDSATTGNGVPITISVLTNDSDPNGDALTVVSLTQPNDGAVNLNPDGTVTYTPPAGFKGKARFDYTISDGNGGTATATVTVTIS
ncbi:MAG TPA: Ig-like domain-containing protein, partial [Patescibacteria group bacterium]|nr:Ig-like domain-containing protein [Patescibacteria group bacterium]